MTGITPAWLTFSGRYVERSAVHAPAHHALGVLHRDAALALLDEHHADDDDQRGHTDRGEDDPAAAVQDAACLRPEFGRRYPTKISSDMPLPMPRSVTSSPIHITSAAPAVITSTMTTRVKMLWLAMMSSVAALQQAAVGRQRHDAGGLQDGQRDSQIARVLRHLGLAGLAFFSQLFEPRNDHGEQLHDDARGDVGHHADREHGQLQQRTAGEQVDQRVDLPGFPAAGLLDALLHVGVVHAGRRQRGAEAVEHDDAEGEQDLPSQVDCSQR